MPDNNIEIKNLSLGYAGKSIIENINADIKAGEMIGIIGPNGAGKSTLLKTLRNLQPKMGGSVKFFGIDNEKITDAAFARIVAYLQQSININFDYTGLEIVLTGRYPYLKWWDNESEADRELAYKCMEYTGTAELAACPINKVSGGQRQRILLAKVLAQQTPILFLDEPTNGLDIVYQEEIFAFASELAKNGKTVLMVVHELNLAAKYCSRIMLLGDNKLLMDSAPQEVLTDELLSKAYGVSVKVKRNSLTGSLEITADLDYEKKNERKKLLKQILI